METSIPRKSRAQGNGFTLIEAIVSIAILVFGIVGVYTAFQSTINVSYQISYKFTAAYLAQEGLEIVNNMRDNNFISGAAWDNGLTSCTQGCQADYKTGTAAADITGEDDLKVYQTTSLSLDSSTGMYDYDSSPGATQTIFARKITIVPQTNPNIIKVDVAVTWNYGGKISTFDAEEFIYNWH